MSELWAISIAGFILAILSALVGACFAKLSSQADKISILSEKIIKLETSFDFWIESVGKKALSLLHSPTDHLRLDQLIEEYEKHDYDLTSEQWEDLRIKCQEISTDVNATKNEKLLATLGRLLADHKKMRYSLEGETLVTQQKNESSN